MIVEPAETRRHPEQCGGSDTHLAQPSQQQGSSFEADELVPGGVLEKEKEIARDRARNEGKPEKVLDRIVEGRLTKFYEEVCLLEQPFVKEATLTIEQLVKTKIAKLGENISIARFIRFKVGDVAAIEAAGEADGAEAAPTAPVSPQAGGGSATVSE